jgi:predicted aconitase with swiveling domain
VLCLPATVGSSSAAAVLLELVHCNRAPAAILLHEPDAILLLGLIVAEEMGLKIPPAYQLDRDTYALLDQRQLHISEQGIILIL